MSQQSVSEVPSPMTTQAPPQCLCSTAAAYESHLCESCECPPVFTPCWVWALWTERLVELTPNNKSLRAPQNAYDNLFGINSCAPAGSHTGFNYGSFNHLLLNSKLISKYIYIYFCFRWSLLQLALLRLLVFNTKSLLKIRQDTVPGFIYLFTLL